MTGEICVIAACAGFLTFCANLMEQHLSLPGVYVLPAYLDANSNFRVVHAMVPCLSGTHL